MKHRTIALAACLWASFTAEAVSLTAQLTAESALVGLQVSARQRHAKGQLAAAPNDCLQALKPSEFFAVTEQVATTALSPAELAAAEAFFGSPTGRKYARFGVLGIYGALGEKAPEAMPALSPADNQAIEAFAASPAGQALFKRQVLQAPAAREAYDRRAQELVMRCQYAPPARPD